jgi:signal transduction histidine kinase
MPLTPEDDVQASRWESVISLGGALALFAAVGWQRSAFIHPRIATLLVVLAAAPWVVNHFWVRVPWPVWVAVVLGAVTSLLWQPLNNDFAPFFFVFLAGTMATGQPRAVSLPVAVLCCAPAGALEAGGRYGGGAVIWSFAVAAAWFFGFGYRWQLSLLEQLRTAQADLGERAAADERRRIAGEIHDLVAHTLAVTVLHLSGARLALQDGETCEALDALTQAEKAGREAMADIRGAVGLLGVGAATGEGRGGAPPGVTDVPGLVDGYSSAGLDVRLRFDLDGAAVSATTGLAAYRIVQEALANAARHAGGQPVTVEVLSATGVLRIAVENPLPAGWSSAREGMGVPGMRQRAGVAGGHATAGPAGPAWLVTTELPLENG